MNDVAHSLGRSTVAEYVESPEIFRLLKICGVDKVQGYYISKPLKQLPHGNVVKFQYPRRSSKDIQKRRFNYCPDTPLKNIAHHVVILDNRCTSLL